MHARHRILVAKFLILIISITLMGMIVINWILVDAHAGSSLWKRFPEHQTSDKATSYLEVAQWVASPAKTLGVVAIVSALLNLVFATDLLRRHSEKEFTDLGLTGARLICGLGCLVISIVVLKGQLIMSALVFAIISTIIGAMIPSIRIRKRPPN
jgi:hypothetical protein